MRTISRLVLGLLALSLVGSTLFASPPQESKKEIAPKTFPRLPPFGDETITSGCNPTNPDLSGDYIGTISVPQMSDVKWKTKLHIVKNEFTLFSATDSGEVKLTGTVSAVKTCDYTGAAFRVVDAVGGLENIALIEGRTFSLKTTPGPIFAFKDVAGQSVNVALYCDCNTCKNPKKCDCCGS